MFNEAIFREIGEAILTKIQKLEKTVIKYSPYTNYLQCSVCYHYNKSLMMEEVSLETKPY